MNTLVIIAVLVILFALFAVGLIFFISKMMRQMKQGDTDGLRLVQSSLQQQMENLASRFETNVRSLDSKFVESNRDMQSHVRTQFSESQILIKDITDKVSEVREKVAEVREANKQVFTIAEQLQNLEKVLKHQKQRGNLGEASLELILSNILPANGFQMQYGFANGEVVDAVIMTRDGLIPVDAKFSLDNYSRVMNERDDVRRAELEKMFVQDLKKRIDETAKYVRIEEGTLPFAFMFIPAEGIYYDLLVNEVGGVKVNTRSLIDYAYNDKKVIIVSPTTFAAYLQSVLYGLKAFKVEENAKKIEANVSQLMKHIGAYEEYFKKMGMTLSTVVNHYNAADKELKKIDKDVYRITGESNEYEIAPIEKPKLLED
jgi:DNA recombination protein RmuC